MNDSTKSTFFTANMMFMVLAYAFIGGSLIMQFVGVGFNLSIAIIQYGIILIPILSIMRYKGVNIKEKFRLNPIKFWTVVKVILVTIAALPIAYTLNFLVNFILIKLDLFQMQTMDLGSGTASFIMATFLVSITPGICEEFFFRGMMFTGYEEKMSPLKAMLISGLFFGLFHFNLQNLMLPTFLGIIFAWLVYTTNSLYSSMIAHGLFNFIGVLIMMNEQGDTSAESLDSALILLEEQGGQILMTLLVVSLFASAFLFLFMYLLKKDYVHLNVGDTLIIKEHHLKVAAVDELSIQIVEEDERKIITKDKLKSLDYKINRDKKQYSKISKWNYVFIGFVLILYIGFTVLIYT